MIIGLNINSIRANREMQPKGEVTVNSVPRITGIEKRDIFDMKDVLAAKFEFKTIYEPHIGEIVFEGEVLYRNSDAAKIVKRFKEEKKVDTKVGAEILNAIFSQCLARAVELSIEVRLPPPVQFPRVVPAKEQK